MLGPELEDAKAEIGKITIPRKREKANSLSIFFMVSSCRFYSKFYKNWAYGGKPVMPPTKIPLKLTLPKLSFGSVVDFERIPA
jgi:hypothetical protein